MKRAVSLQPPSCSLGGSSIVALLRLSLGFVVLVASVLTDDSPGLSDSGNGSQ